MAESFYPITGTIAIALTFKEEIALLKRWKKKQDCNARDTLIKNYVLFSVKQIKRMYPALPEDDAILIAHEALLESIEKFNPYRAKLGRLSNLIPYYCKVAFRNFRRRAETVKCPIKEGAPEGGRYQSTSTSYSATAEGPGFPEDEMGGADPANEHASLDELFGTASSAAEDFDLAERKEAIIAALETLPDGLHVIIYKCYFDNLSFAEIARQNEPPITREAVRQKHNRALQLLREAIKKQDIIHS